MDSTPGARVIYTNGAAPDPHCRPSLSVLSCHHTGVPVSALEGRLARSPIFISAFGPCKRWESLEGWEPEVSCGPGKLLIAR